MKKLTYLFLLSLFSLTFLFISCNDEGPQDEPEGKYTIQVSPDEGVTFGQQGGTAIFTVETEAADWEPTTSVSWMKIDRTPGSNRFEVKVYSFDEVGKRTADIRIGGENTETKTITITQTDQEDIYSVSAKQVLFVKTGGKETVAVNFTYEWDFEYDADWYDVQRDGDNLIISANSVSKTDFLEIDRIKITSGDIQKTITVAQSGKDYIHTTDKDEINISEENEQYYLEVISTLPWVFKLGTEDYGVWLDAEQIDECTLLVSCKINTYYVGRVGWIYLFESPNIDYADFKMINVYQAPDKSVDKYILEVDKTEFFFSFLGTSIDAFRVNTYDTDYTIEKDPNSSWLFLQAVEGNPYLWTLQATKNNGTERSATITISREDHDGEVVLTVTQGKNNEPKPGNYFGHTMATLPGRYELTGERYDGTEMRTETYFEYTYGMFSGDLLSKFTMFLLNKDKSDGDEYKYNYTQTSWITHTDGKEMLIIDCGSPVHIDYTEPWADKIEYDLWMVYCVVNPDNASDILILPADYYIPWQLDVDNKEIFYSQVYSGSEARFNGEPVCLGVFKFAKGDRSTILATKLPPVHTLKYKLLSPLTEL